MNNISKYFIIATLVLFASVTLKSEYKATTYAYDEEGASQWLVDNIDSYLATDEDIADIPDGFAELIIDKYYILTRGDGMTGYWQLITSNYPLTLSFGSGISVGSAGLCGIATTGTGDVNMYHCTNGYSDWELVFSQSFDNYNPLDPITVYASDSYSFSHFGYSWTFYQTNCDLGVTIDGTYQTVFPISGSSEPEEPDTPEDTSDKYRPMDGDSYFSHFISVNGEWVNQWQVTEGDIGTTSVMVSGIDHIGDNSLFYLNYVPISGDYPKVNTWNSINYTITLDADIPDLLSTRVELSSYNILSARYLNKYTGEYEYLGVGDVIFTNEANQITFSFACNLDEVEILEFFITGDYLDFCRLGTLNTAIYNTIDYTYVFNNATGTYTYGIVDSGIDLSPSFENPDLSLLPDLVIPDFSALGLGQVLTALCSIDVVRLMLITCVVMGVLSYVVFGKRG